MIAGYYTKLDCMKRITLLLVLQAIVCTIVAQQNTKPVLIPSRFIDGARFYIQILSVNNDTLLGFADTGGGFTAIYPGTVDRLQLAGQVQTIQSEIGELGALPFTDVVKDDRIPKIEIPFFLTLKESSFMVPPKQIMESEIREIVKAIPHDIFLGQYFFIGKAWTFDYRKQEVWVNTPVLKTNANAANVQLLGFKKDKDGKKLYGHPSMKVVIDGDTLDVLFDTGASFLLSAAGRTNLNTTQLSMGGSFIARSVFDRWRQKHPDWKVFEKSDGQADIIEVPEIKIGSYTAGPVLFSVRPDEAWSKGMISSMDKVVLGAVGGSALKYFTVKADYNQELIEFIKR